MYQDPDVAQIIRKLERKKLDAVSSEHSVAVFISRNMNRIGISSIG